MAKKTSTEEEFQQLVRRMHNSADLRILSDYIKLMRNECKVQRYDLRLLEAPQALATVSGQEWSLDKLLEDMADALDS